MLTAQLYLLNQTLGGAGTLNLVQLGVLIAEDDATLPFRTVSGIVSWGDGSPVFTISPISGQISYPSSVTISYSGSSAILSLNPIPSTGTFNLTYADNAVNSIPFNVDSGELQQLLTTAAADSSTVSVTGEAPSWKVLFETPEAAQLLVAGADSLFSPLPLPVHVYGNGNFTAVLNAQNYRSPDPDLAFAPLDLGLQQLPAGTAAAPILVGPILPADVGFPNEDQWNFNISTDLKVLASNVKMILLVEPGQRLMMPTYGCALQQFIFDPAVVSTAQDISAEIQKAITTWEPRVTIQNINTVLNRNSRSVSVSLLLASNLNQATFLLNVEVAR